ncbi:MAG: hypothetical protein ACR2PX_28295 [Endozoicomonas sp.]|uniref:hypothetical protein n=1 Tax=Endozoicomonas sp. TaxID=1892382 RepID=UPI003D9ACFF5
MSLKVNGHKYIIHTYALVVSHTQKNTFRLIDSIEQIPPHDRQFYQVQAIIMDLGVCRT